MEKKEYNGKQYNKNVIQNKHKKAWLAYFISLMAAILSACGTFFLKVTNENNMTIVLIRCSIQFLILLPVLTWRKTDLIVTDKKIMIYVLIHGMISPNVLLFMGLSMNFLSLGDAMGIFYTYPVFVGFFACLCLNEKYGALNIILTITTMGGFVLIAQPSFIFNGYNDTSINENEDLRLIGALLGTIASVQAGLTAVLLRKVGSAVHFTQTMLHAGWEGTLVNAIVLAASGTSFQPCFQSLPTILGCSLSFFLSEIFRTIAYQLEEAGPVTLIQTSQVLFSFLLQYIFLNEVPNLLSVIGSLLILISCISLGIKNTLKTIKTKQ